MLFETLEQDSSKIKQKASSLDLGFLTSVHCFYFRIVPEKVLAGMQWSSEHLSSEWIYASLDDDVVVMMPNLVLYLESLFEPAENNSAVTMSPCYEDLPIVCVYSYQPHDVPARDPKVKWFISKVDYPDQKWPVHCRGGLYLMSNKLASDIFSVSRTTPRLHLDDVWITGLMRRKLNYGDCNIIVSCKASLYVCFYIFYSKLFKMN